MTMQEFQKLKSGDVLIYNDGREGHQNVKAKVLAVSLFTDFTLVQFEDRADTTTIKVSDKEWLNNLTLLVRNNSRQADRFAWNECCRQFPRLKSFDGAKP